MPQEFKDTELPNLLPQRPNVSCVTPIQIQMLRSQYFRQQTFVAGGTSNFSRPQPSPQQFTPQYERNEPWNSHDRPGQDRQLGYGSMDGIRAPAIPGQEEANYSTFEEAEAAFFKLLKRSGVQQDWTFDQMVKACVRDSQYRAIKDPRERKLAFEKYAVEQRAQEREREKERVAKLRNDFGVMLRRHPEIKYYSRWRTVRPIIESESIFRSTDNEDERRTLFEEYIAELRRYNDEQEASTRKAAMDELTDILNSLNLEPYTRWSEAQELIQSNANFKNDPKFETLHRSHILTAFEEHIKQLEREFNDKRQKEKSLKFRRERRNRDAFKDLLRELKADGHIKAGSKWMNVYPLVKDDHRFTDMLGQTGSTPLDFFWDIVEEEELILRSKRNDVLDVLDDEHYEITPQTTVDSFLDVVRNDRRTANFDTESLQLIFERQKEKVSKRAEESSYYAEKRQRRAIDDLRSRIKHLDPPVSLSDTWDRVRPRVESTPEYKALDTDEPRKMAFDKFQRRLREKTEDAERDRERRHRDRHESRNGVSGSHRDRGDRDREHRRHRSRSPEVDAYEADRRKAIADRERQYRKSSVTGLSPPPRSPHVRTGRDERDWRDRRDGWHGGSGYEGSRRDREGDRERGYGSRSELRSKTRVLDYGDDPGTEGGGSGPGSLRRRRSEESEGSEGHWVHKVGHI